MIINRLKTVLFGGVSKLTAEIQQ